MVDNSNVTYTNTLSKGIGRARKWSEVSFGSLFSEATRNGIYKTLEFQGRGTRIVNMGEMFGIEIMRDQEMSRVELSKKELALNGLQEGDLLFGRRSVVPAGAGKCSIVGPLSEPLTFESSIIRVRLQLEENNPLFYYYFFASNYGRLVMSAIVTGTNIKGIRSSELKDLIVPLPSKAEQIYIATALSDADALISSLEKLIEKKRNIKQGAMQELLKPKKGWVVKKLGEICEIKKGQLITEATAINGEIPVIAGGKKPSYFHNIANRFNKTITVSGSGANAGFVAYFETPIFASDCSTIEEGSTYSIEYIFYNLQLLQNKIYKAQTGGAQPHIHPIDLAPFEIPFPELNIQRSISLVLSDMDAEIESLEKKLAKLKMIKQGMMQELLTGKIRLI